MDINVRMCICVHVYMCVYVCVYMRKGTDVEALDDRGISPLRLAHSRLKIAKSKEDEGGLALTRKMEVGRIVDMLKEFLRATRSSKEETQGLEELAGKLSLCETPQQVGVIKGISIMAVMFWFIFV